MKVEVYSELIPERVQVNFPVHTEPKIPTLDQPVIIESACPGWQVGGDRFPAVPISIEDQVNEIVDSIKAGAVAVHIHPRNPETGNAKVDPHLLAKVMDPIFDQVGDCVTLNHTWTASEEADYISETETLLEMGKGNKYCQGSVVLPVGFLSSTGAYHTGKSVYEGIQWLEKNDIKPIYQLYDTYVIWWLQQNVLSKNLSNWKPYVFNLHLGKHHSHAIHADPWAHLQLITNFNIVKQTAPDSVIGVYPGGRNWLPTLTMGLLLGAQLVRVGVEDCYWLYPHKDELIRKNSDVVKMAVDLCNILGRRVVTDAKEAREILGMKLTSR